MPVRCRLLIANEYLESSTKAVAMLVAILLGCFIDLRGLKIAVLLNHTYKPSKLVYWAHPPSATDTSPNTIQSKSLC